MEKLWSVLRDPLFYFVLPAIAAAVVVTAAHGVTYFRTPKHPAVTTITYNGGGFLTDFIEEYSAARHRGTRFVIDGQCISACTLITGEIPKDHVCITPYATLGFHAAYTEDKQGARVFSVDGSAQLWQIYPPEVRAMLQRHGWKSPTVDQPIVIWIGYDELRTIYKTCA